MFTGSLTIGAQTTEITPTAHVEAARGLLEKVSDKSLKKNARVRLEELRKLFDDMSKSYPGSADWRVKFSAVESQLTRLIGGGRGPGLEAATAGAGDGNIAGAAGTLGGGLNDQPGGVTGTAGTAGAAGTAGGVGGAAQAGSASGGSSAGAANGGAAAPSSGTPATAIQPGGVPIGGGSVQGAAAGGSGTQVTSAGMNAGTAAVSSSGTAVGAGGGIAVVGEIGMKDLDPKIREQLRQFRLEVELFFSSAVSDSSQTGGGANNAGKK